MRNPAPRVVDPRHFGLDEDEALLPLADALEVRRGRSLARQDLKKLLALDREGQRARVEDTESRRSFRSRALAELLLAESRDRIADDPDEAAHLAGLAHRVLHWTPGPLGESWRETVHGRATAHQANALRRAGRLDEAERLFALLHQRMLGHHLGSPRLLAEAAGWEAALRWRQGREAEASRLLAEAADAHRRAGSRRGLVCCLRRWGDLLRSTREAAAAAEVLAWAARVVEPASFAAERRVTLLALGQALCDAGRPAEARRHLDEAAAAGGGDGDPLLADLAWLAGRCEPSLPRLTAAGRALARAGRPGAAALAALDRLALPRPPAAAAARAEVAEDLHALAAAEGLAPLLRDWFLLAAGRVGAAAGSSGGSAQRATGPGASGPGGPAVAAGSSPDGGPPLREIRFVLLREAALAAWAAD